MSEAPWRGVRRFVAYAVLMLAPILVLGLLQTRSMVREADRSALSTGALQGPR